MNQVFFYMSLGFWMEMVLHSYFLIAGFSFFFALFLWITFKKRGIFILWILITILSLVFSNSNYQEAKEGNYTIQEIKTNYCLASDGDTTIVLYGIEHPNYSEIYLVSSIKKIQTTKNMHLFSFETYMKKRGIEYCGYSSDTQLIKSSHTFRSKVYTLVSNHELLKSNLYGIYDESQAEIITRLGLPVIGLFSILQSLLKRWFEDRQIRILLILLAIGCGWTFTFTMSLVRWILFQMGRLFFASWEGSTSFSIFSFLFLFPYASLEFAFVLPCLLRFLYHFVKDKMKQKVYLQIILFFLQCIYFHQVNLLFLFGFSFIRTITSICMLLFWIPSIYQFWDTILSTLPVLEISYTPNVLFYLCLFLFLCFKKYRHLILLCCMPWIQSYCDPFFHVYMLDIGQGDCTLIVEPFHQSAVMIDCGQNLYRDNVKEIMVPVLKDLQIDSLDCLIVTHDDYDHSGGVEELKEFIEVKETITDSNTKVPVSYPFYSLLPEREAKDENEKSILSYFAYDGVSYLWMGDADTKIEEQLINTYNLDVDILKLGHHGSSTSSSFEFLDSVRPNLGLVSVGANNRYNHPSNEVISNCHELGIHVLETKDVGMIHIQSLHGLSFFSTATYLFGIMS